MHEGLDDDFIFQHLHGADQIVIPIRRSFLSPQLRRIGEFCLAGIDDFAHTFKRGRSLEHTLLRVFGQNNWEREAIAKHNLAG